MAFWDNLLDKIGKGIVSLSNIGKTNTYSGTTSDYEGGKKETLNQQISNGNINGNNATNQNDANINGLKNNLAELDLKENSLDVDTTDNTTIKSTSVKQDDKESRSFWDMLTDKDELIDLGLNFLKGTTESISNAYNYASDVVNSRRAKAEYNGKEQLFAVGYNKDNGNVRYLDLNEDRGFFDYDWGTRSGTEDLYNKELNKFLVATDERNNSTQQDITNAWIDFYNNTKGLFRVREDDYYTDGLFGDVTVGRRKNMYTQDELDTLAKNDVRKGRYEPTFDEFTAFVSMKENNRNTLTNIRDKYGLNRPEEDEPEEFDMSSGFQSERKENMMSIGNSNIDEYLAPLASINPNARTNALLSYEGILSSQFDRIYQKEAPVFKAEREIRNRDSSTRTTADLYILDTAEKFREMDREYARGLNEWFRQTIKYGTDSRGEIVDALDYFENGESLGELLGGKVKELSGRDWRGHQSVIDVFSSMANEALYLYTQEKNKGSLEGAIKNFWGDVEYFFEPLGENLGELGNQIMARSLDALNIAVTGRDSTSADYIDQDISIGKLIETDDGNVKRTIKKYALDFAEYAPEAVGNLIPDIAAIVATGGGAGATLLRHAKDVNKTLKLVKTAEGASMLNKFRAFTRGTDFVGAGRRLGLGESTVSKIINAAKSSKTVDQTTKTAAALIDRAVTQVGLGQIMDAQWSAYDSEPYSDMSFWMSAIGSTVFDAFPEIFRLATGKGWFKSLVLGQDDNIWSLAKYIDSSDEAAENVARALGKGAGDIGLDDLRAYVKQYSTIEEMAKQVYDNQLSDAEREAIGKWTKNMAYNFVSQAYGSNSNIGKNIRRMLANGSTNIADVVKYLGRIPGDVSIGPYVSTIKLKGGTNAVALGAREGGEYNKGLDTIIQGGFDRKVRDGFSQKDIDRLAKEDGYSKISSNQDKFFYEDNGKFYLTEDGLNLFGMKAENLTLEALGISLKDAENTKELFKEKMKNIKGKKISDTTVDVVAETGGYDETVLKVKEVLGC